MWLTRYLEYTAENEAPEQFHFWCAVAILGHALNRKVWVDQHYDKLYPGQIMVVLVSDSAVSRKSTAINLAVKFLSQLPDEYINIIDGKVSNATLVDALVRVDEEGHQLPGIGFLVADEMALMFTRESWAETLVTDVTALNTQCDRSFRRRMRTKDVEIPLPCLGGLFGTTPTGLANELPKAAQTAGFFGRLITVHQEESERINDLLDPPKQHKELRAWLIKDLYRIAKLNGPFGFTDDGYHFYRAWYRKFREDAPKGDDESTGFYGRKHSHVLRIAMVLSAARDSTRFLDASILEASVKAIAMIEKEMPQAYVKIDVTNPLVTVQDRIVSILTREGGSVTMTMLHRHLSHRYGNTVRAAVHQMAEANVVIVERVPSKTKPTLWVRLAPTRGEMLTGVPVVVLGEAGIDE